MFFKPWPEYQTKNPLFKPSIMQPIGQTTYDLNNELLVCYLSHYLNNKPFKRWTILDHSNTEQFAVQIPSAILKLSSLKWFDRTQLVFPCVINFFTIFYRNLASVLPLKPSPWNCTYLRRQLESVTTSGDLWRHNPLRTSSCCSFLWTLSCSCSRYLPWFCHACFC